MIGIDTDVLLRHTLDDDVAQSPIATAFLMDDGRVTEPPWSTRCCSSNSCGR